MLMQAGRNQLFCHIGTSMTDCQYSAIHRHQSRLRNTISSTDVENPTKFIIRRCREHAVSIDLISMNNAKQVRKHRQAERKNFSNLDAQIASKLCFGWPRSADFPLFSQKWKVEKKSSLNFKRPLAISHMIIQEYQSKSPTNLK
jgi:hypothetical protein